MLTGCKLVASRRRRREHRPLQDGAGAGEVRQEAIVACPGGGRPAEKGTEKFRGGWQSAEEKTERKEEACSRVGMGGEKLGESARERTGRAWRLCADDKSPPRADREGGGC